MKSLLEAIKAHYDASALALTLNGFYRGTVPAGVAEPYGRYFEVSDMPDYTFDSVHEDILIQIDIFAPEADLPQLFEEMKSCFDDCLFTITGNRLVSFERDISRSLPDENGEWNHRMTQYRVRTEKL